MTVTVILTGDILENKGSVRWVSKGHYAEGGKKLSGGVKGVKNMKYEFYTF